MIMTTKYDATYKLGNTTVHVIAPKNQTMEEKEKVLNELHNAGWSIWDSLSQEEKKKINKSK
jgi:hypothetical protein